MFTWCHTNEINKISRNTSNLINKCLGYKIDTHEIKEISRNTTNLHILQINSDGAFYIGTANGTYLAVLREHGISAWFAKCMATRITRECDTIILAYWTH